jgi:hypothetical protein
MATKFLAGVFNLPSAGGVAATAQISGDWFVMLGQAGCALQAQFDGGPMEDFALRQMHVGRFSTVTLSAVKWAAFGSVPEGASGYYMYGDGDPPQLPSIADSNMMYGDLAFNVAGAPGTAEKLSVTVSNLFGDPWQYAVYVGMVNDASMNTSCYLSCNQTFLAKGRLLIPGAAEIRIRTSMDVYIHNNGATTPNLYGYIERLR